MKIHYLYHLIVLLLLGLFLSGCHKQNNDIVNPEKGVFNFVVTEAQREYINSSRGEQYEITDPIPELHFEGTVYTLDRFEIRGDNTLKFTRKGFGVNMNSKIILFNPDRTKGEKVRGI